MLREMETRGARLVQLATPARTATDRERGALVATAVLLVTATAITLFPYLAALVLALWAAHLARPLYDRFRRLLHGRERGASLVTGLLVLVASAPIALMVVALVPAGRSLFAQLRGANGGKGVLQALVSNGAAGGAEGKGLIALAKDYGAGASKALALIANVSIDALLAAFVFFSIFHALLVDGGKWWGWIRERAPLGPPVLDRLGAAFHQAGRGLIVGTGLTALIQGALATVIYAAFGVPRALLLGLLSVIGALIPMTGPMIVWVPVAAGLAFSGETGKAIGVAVLCAAVVGTVDNVLRPWLSKRFQVGLPTAVVLVGMLGGLVVFGGWGILLGPLFVRLAGEILEICRERRAFGAAYSKTP
jgi:predicted PurR-regulated permease PerM